MNNESSVNLSDSGAQSIHELIGWNDHALRFLMLSGIQFRPMEMYPAGHGPTRKAQEALARESLRRKELGHPPLTAILPLFQKEDEEVYASYVEIMLIREFMNREDRVDITRHIFKECRVRYFDEERVSILFDRLTDNVRGYFKGAYANDIGYRLKSFDVLCKDAVNGRQFIDCDIFNGFLSEFGSAGYVALSVVQHWLRYPSMEKGGKMPSHFHIEYDVLPMDDMKGNIEIFDHEGNPHDLVVLSLVEGPVKILDGAWEEAIHYAIVYEGAKEVGWGLVSKQS